MLLITLFISLSFCLAPLSYFTHQIQQKGSHSFLTFSIEELTNDLEEHLDDVPLYLGKISGRAFRDEFKTHLKKLKNKELEGAFFFLELFNRTAFIGADFHYKLMTNQEFFELIHQYQTFKQLLQALLDFRKRLNPQEFLDEDILRTLLEYPNSIAINNHFEHLPFPCIDLLDCIQVLFFLRKNPCVAVPLPTLESALVLLQSRSVLYSGFQHTNPFDIFYHYDLSTGQKSGLKPHLLKYMSLESTIRTHFEYKDDLLKLFPLNRFPLQTIEENYLKQGYPTLFDAIFNKDTTIITSSVGEYTLKHKPNPLWIIQKLKEKNMEYFVDNSRFFMYLITHSSKNSLEQEKDFIESLVSNLSACDEKIWAQEWSHQPQIKIGYLYILQAFALSPQEVSYIFPFLPLFDKCALLTRIDDTLFAQSFSCFQPLLLEDFPLPPPSLLHRNLKRSLKKTLPFLEDQLQTPPWSDLTQVTILGRTVYGFDPQNQQWIAYKFLKQRENHFELIQGEIVHLELQKLAPLTSHQKTMGLWRNRHLSPTILQHTFPQNKNSTDLFNFENDGSIVYRKYSTPNEKVFHYPYEEEFSFEEATYGIHKSLKEAGQLWRKCCYLTSVASFSHNSSREQNYFPATIFRPSTLLLGKLTSWNQHATDHCDFRMDGLADQEDLLLEVNLDWIQSFRGIFPQCQALDNHNEQLLAINTLCQFLLLADLLVFRKYVNLFKKGQAPQEEQLKKSIQDNYITLFQAISNCTEEEAFQILNNETLFPWDTYIKENLREMFPHPQKYEEAFESDNYVLYNKGLTPSGAYKESLSSEGDNLGGFNEPYPIPTLNLIFYSFVLCIHRHFIKNPRAFNRPEIPPKPTTFPPKNSKLTNPFLPYSKFITSSV